MCMIVYLCASSYGDCLHVCYSYLCWVCLPDMCTHKHIISKIWSSYMYSVITLWVMIPLHTCPKCMYIVPQGAPCSYIYTGKLSKHSHNYSRFLLVHPVYWKCPWPHEQLVLSVQAQPKETLGFCKPKACQYHSYMITCVTYIVIPFIFAVAVAHVGNPTAVGRLVCAYGCVREHIIIILCLLYYLSFLQNCPHGRPTIRHLLNLSVD